MLYHYTSLQSLALILSSRKMRFSRLDIVDDVREAQTVSGLSFGQVLFVSCWTSSETEQIPLWNMYTPGMAGVRIGVPDMPFREATIKEAPPFRFEGASEARVVFDFAELSTAEHCIHPVSLAHQFFAGGVDYVPDPAAQWRRNLKWSSDDRGNSSVEVSEFTKLVRLKSECWAFQSEYRFALMVLPPIPGVPAFGAVEYPHNLVRHTLDSLRGSIVPSFSYFEVPLSDEAVRNMEITLGPKASVADRLLLEALLAKYAPSSTLRDSSLAGTIRTPIRR